MEFTIQNIPALRQVAQSLLAFSASSRKRIITFTGDLGAGKTTLIQHICVLLDAEDVVSSPTFSIVNEYKTPHLPIFHIDLYRLNDLEEALAMGIETYLDHPTAICLIEWPQVIEPLLRADEVIQVNINHELSGERVIRYETVKN